jgi:phage shock protein C
MNAIQQRFAGRGLVRPRNHRLIAGVCSGLGQRFGFNPGPARLLFVVVLCLIPGSQIIIYPVLWVLMPNEGSN